MFSTQKGLSPLWLSSRLLEWCGLEWKMRMSASEISCFELKPNEVGLRWSKRMGFNQRINMLGSFKLWGLFPHKRAGRGGQSFSGPHSALTRLVWPPLPWLSSEWLSPPVALHTCKEVLFYFIFLSCSSGDFRRSSSSGLLNSKHVEARECIVLTVRLHEPTRNPGCSMDALLTLSECVATQCSQFACLLLIDHMAWLFCVQQHPSHYAVASFAERLCIFS